MKPSTRVALITRVLLAAVLAFPAPPAAADEIFTLTATADAVVDQNAPTTNDGASAILRTLSQLGANQRSLVQFDLTGVDSTAAIKTSRLKMTLGAAPGQSRNLAAHAVNDQGGSSGPWTQGGVTWDTRDGVTAWNNAGGDFFSAADTQPSGTTGGAQLSWNIRGDGTNPNIPQAWLNGSLANRGLLVKDAAEDDAAHATIVKVVTEAPVSMCTGSCTLDVTLPGAQSVNTARSVLFFQVRSSANGVPAYQIRGELLSSTQVRFTRSGNPTAVQVKYYVVEFNDAVVVERGTVNQGVATTPPSTIDVPLTQFSSNGITSVNQMFVLYSKTPVATDLTFSMENPVVADVTSPDNLRILIGNTNAAHNIHYQVVGFLNPSDISVQHNSTTAFSVAGTTSVTLPISAVDAGRSFALLSYFSTGTTGGSGTFDGNDFGARVLSAGLTTSGGGACTTNCDGLTISRAIPGNDVINQVSYQVVTLNTGAGAQHGSSAFAANPAAPQTNSIALASSVDLARSWAFSSSQFGGGQNGGSTSHNLNQNAGPATFTFDLISGTQLDIARIYTGSSGAASVEWNVVEMNSANPALLQFASLEDGVAANRPQLDLSLLRNVTPGVITPGISEITLNWAFPGGSTSANYQGVLFARNQGGVPTFAPADGTSYNVGDIFGTDIIAANTPDFSTTSIFDENGADNVILPNTAYAYRGFTRDNNSIAGATVVTPPHYSAGVDIPVTTLVPGPADKNWSYRTGAVTLAPPGFTTNGTVVIGSNDAKFHSMDAATGGRRYQPAGVTGITGGAMQARPPVIPAGLTTGLDCDPGIPVTPCDISFVGDDVGDVYAFDVNTGTPVWSMNVAPVGAVQGGAAVQLSLFSNAGFTPACAPCDLVLVGTRLTGDAVNNRLVALNAASGAVVWSFQPGNLDIIVSTPVVSYTTNHVWFASLSNGGTQPSLWKLNSSDGTLVESFSLGDISNSPSPSQTGMAIYAVTDAGTLQVVRTDVAACSLSLAAAAGTAVGAPFPNFLGATDDDIYFVTTNTMNKFHATLVPATCGSDTLTDLNGGAWTNPALTNPSGVVLLPNPTVASLQVFVGDGTGRVLRIDPVTGAIAASRDVELGQILGEPALDVPGARILVGSSSGRVFSHNFF